MRDKICGYLDYEVIRKYEKLKGKILIVYLDGSVCEVGLDQEKDIIQLMEKQGKDYASEYGGKRKYLVKVFGSSVSLIFLLFGTFQGMENLCSNGNVENEGLLLGSILGGICLTVDVILWKKLFGSIVAQSNHFDEVGKYYYYFDHYDILKDYIGINDLDNYDLSSLCNMVSGESAMGKRKKLVRKR